MSTEIIPIGLPALASVSVAGEELLQGSTSSGRHTAQLGLGQGGKHAVLVAFSKRVDEGTELDTGWAPILIQPLSRSRRRIAKRRAWTKLNVCHSQDSTSPSVVCYYLYVSPDPLKRHAAMLLTASRTRMRVIDYLSAPSPRLLASWVGSLTTYLSQNSRYPELTTHVPTTDVCLDALTERSRADEQIPSLNVSSPRHPSASSCSTV